MEDDDLVGKEARFKNPKYPWEKGTHRIIGKQLLWGMDDYERYGLIVGYRIASDNIQMGKAVLLDDIEIIE